MRPRTTEILVKSSKFSRSHTFTSHVADNRLSNGIGIRPTLAEWDTGSLNWPRKRRIVDRKQVQNDLRGVEASVHCQSSKQWLSILLLPLKPDKKLKSLVKNSIAKVTDDENESSEKSVSNKTGFWVLLVDSVAFETLQAGLFPVWGPALTKPTVFIDDLL